MGEAGRDARLKGVPPLKGLAPSLGSDGKSAAAELAALPPPVAAAAAPDEAATAAPAAAPAIDDF